MGLVRYHYTIAGRGGNGNTWTVNGDVDTGGEGGFTQAIHAAQQQTFERLTAGKHVEFGHPGPCGGPYRIDRLVIERIGEQV